MTSIVFVNARQLWKNKKESKDIMRDIAREREREREREGRRRKNSINVIYSTKMRLSFLSHS
jgi:hypothetical protein